MRRSCVIIWWGLLCLLPGKALAGPLALHNLNLVDVENLGIVAGQTVLIENGRIKAIVAAGSWQPADGVVSIDLTGKYLVPGFIDAHVHLATDPERDDREDITLRRLRELARGGVTSVRDMGGDVRALAALKRRAEIDVITAPDIYYSVILAGAEFFRDPRSVSSAKGRVPGEVDWMRALAGQVDYDTVVIRAQGAGASGLKVYADVTLEQLQQVAAAAARHGMQLWSHAYHDAVSPGQVSASGVDVMSHAPYLAAERIPGYYRWHRGGVVPDTALAESLDPEGYAELFDELLRNGTMLDATLTVFELTRDAGPARDVMYQHAVMFTRMAAERGIPLVTGTDTSADVSGLPFPAVHYEMQLLVKDAGLSPLQALQAATINAARAIGIDDRVGSVAVGKVANLVVLDGNPAEQIENSLGIAHVLKNGHFLYRGSDPRLPFSSVREGRASLWLSGQIGNFPGTLSFAGNSIESQTRQAMVNIGAVLEDYGMDYQNLKKCTLMLADIEEWGRASEVYKSFFVPPLPARSAFAASGLALGAKVEIECIAEH